MTFRFVYSFGAALFIASCTPKSNGPQNQSKAESTQSLEELPSTEMVHQFLSPCHLAQWKEDLEFYESRNFIKQGFALVSVTPVVPDSQGKYENSDNPDVEVKPALGSCRWTFVKSPGTGSPLFPAPQGSEVVSQWRSPCNLEHWDKEANFDELQSMTKKGYSLVAATPIIGDQNGNYAGFPENTKPAPGSCFWTFALNPK